MSVIEASQPFASRLRRPGEGGLRLAIAVLAVLGIAISTYLAISHCSGAQPVCIAGGTGCATIAQSSYSEIGGVSVALLGVFGYVALLASAALRGDVGRYTGFGLAIAGVGFSIYLTYLELFVIEAICQWCVASAVVMAFLLLLTTTRAVSFGGHRG